MKREFLMFRSKKFVCRLGFDTFFVFMCGSDLKSRFFWRKLIYTSKVDFDFRKRLLAHAILRARAHFKRTLQCVAILLYLVLPVQMCEEGRRFPWWRTDLCVFAKF